MLPQKRLYCTTTIELQSAGRRLEMKVQIISEAGETIWERGENEGLACRSYVVGGTQKAIINALKRALEQAEAELILFDDVDRVSEVCAAST
jgi:hypothetical protein